MLLLLIIIMRHSSRDGEEEQECIEPIRISAQSRIHELRIIYRKSTRSQ